MGFVLAPTDYQAYSRCECQYIIRAYNLVKHAPEPIRIGLKGRRLIPQVIYRTFPRMTWTADPILPSETVARYGVGLEDQKVIIDKLSSNPLLGVSFYGQTGIGKSFLMWAKAQECAYAGIDVIFRTASQFLAGIKASVESEMEDPDGIYTPEDLSRPTSIFLDELDNFQDTDFARRKFFELADSCWRHISLIRLTFASNLPEVELTKKLGPATMRRFNELTNYSIDQGE